MLSHSHSDSDDLVFLQFGDQSWQGTLCACGRTVGPHRGDPCESPEENLQEIQLQGTLSLEVMLLCTLKGDGVQLGC